jgi:hypothetical protein
MSTGSGKLRGIVLAAVLSVTVMETVLRLSGHGALPPPPFLNQHYSPEGYSRPDSLTGYALTPGRFTVTYNDSLRWEATHLADGARWSGPGPEDTAPGIHLYGCSNIYGIGLDDSVTIGWRLQGLMPGHRVMNFSIGGGSLVRSLLLMQHHLDRYGTPEAVLVSYASYYDERNTMARRWRCTLLPNVRRHALLDEVRLPYAAVRGGRIETGSSGLDCCRFPMSGRSALMASADRAWDSIDLLARRPQAVAEGLLRQMDVLCRQDGVRLIVLLLTDDGPTDRVVRMLTDEGVEHVRLRLPDDGRKYDLMPYDPHPNAAAAEVLARQMHRAICR